MNEPIGLPGLSCPQCGATPRPYPRGRAILHETPILVNSGLGYRREYRCWDCAKTWSVDGRQVPLLNMDGEVMTFDLD